MIEINNLTANRIDKKNLKRIAERVLKGEKKEKKAISIALVGKIRIKELNRKYRKKNKATDVLSFSYEGGGEIVLSPEIIKENARKFNLSAKEELARSLIHGILHLLGHDHEKTEKEEKKMQNLQDNYLKICQKLI